MLPIMCNAKAWKGNDGNIRKKNGIADGLHYWLSIRLERQRHVDYIERGLEHLGRWMVALDASRPWLTYWMLHSLDLLETPLRAEILTR